MIRVIINDGDPVTAAVRGDRILVDNADINGLYGAVAVWRVIEVKHTVSLPKGSGTGCLHAMNVSIVPDLYMFNIQDTNIDHVNIEIQVRKPGTFISVSRIKILDLLDFGREHAKLGAYISELVRERSGEGLQ